MAAVWVLCYLVCSSPQHVLHLTLLAFSLRFQDFCPSSNTSTYHLSLTTDGSHPGRHAVLGDNPPAKPSRPLPTSPPCRLPALWPCLGSPPCQSEDLPLENSPVPTSCHGGTSSSRPSTPSPPPPAPLLLGADHNSLPLRGKSGRLLPRALPRAKQRKRKGTEVLNYEREEERRC